MRAVEGPAGVTLDDSLRLLRLTQHRDALGAHAQIAAMNRDATIEPALRAWLLVCAELGAARLPGGALAEDVGRWWDDTPPALEERWQTCVRMTLNRATHRDGAGVRAAIVEGMAAPGSLSYLAGLAGAAADVIDRVSVSTDLLAATHLIGHYAQAPGWFGVAGIGVRLVAATLSIIDIGPGAADMIISPEITTLMHLDSLQRATLLGVLGPAYASVMGDATGAQPHPTSGSTQTRACELAVTVGQAYRSRTTGAVVALADTLRPDEVALAGFGLGQMLAVRARELWGPA